MKKYRKIFSLLLSCSICLSLFSSCEKAGTELSDLMIIQGIGVDFEAGEYTATVEILNNEQSGSPGGNTASENKTKIYSAKGNSISEALRLLTSKSGNIPLFAHNRVIVVGETVKTDVLSEILSFFVRNYDSRASQLLCVSKNKSAEDVIRAKLFTDTVKTEILENLLYEGAREMLIPRIRVIDAFNSLLNKNATLCVPAVTVNKNGDNEDYALSGCAIFENGKGISSFLSAYEAQGLAILCNDGESGFFTEKNDGGKPVAFLVNKCKSQFKVHTKNGNLVYEININISCDLDEIGEYTKLQNGQKVISDLKNLVKKAVSGRTEAALKVLQLPSGGDAVRFYRILELSNPKLYNKLKSDWKTYFSGAKAEINVNVTIRRIGEETLIRGK